MSGVDGNYYEDDYGQQWSKNDPPSPMKQEISRTHFTINLRGPQVEQMQKLCKILNTDENGVLHTAFNELVDMLGAYK